MKSNYYNIIFLSLLICALSLPISAQQMTGKVVDQSDNSPIEFANVVLLSADSTFVSGVISTTDGTFSLPLPAGGRGKMVRVSYVGYRNSVLPCKEGDAGTIALAPEAQMLQETVVTARRPLFKVTPTGIETDVSKSILSTLPDANEVLKYLPGVSGDEGSFNVFGRGKATIYLNGRQLHDPTQLKLLTGNDIQSVEIIRNPGARYKNSTGAVILIKTKKKAGEGWSGNFSTSYVRSRENSYTALGSMMYRKNGLELSGSLSYDDGSRYTDQTGSQEIYGKTTQSNRANIYSRMKYLYGSAGIVYEFNEHHSVGARYMGTKGKTDSHLDNAVEVTQGGALLEQLDYWTDYLDSNPVHQFSGYYLGEFGKWSTSLDLDLYTTKKDQDQHTRESGAGGVAGQKVTTGNRQEAQLYAAKLMAGRQLWKGNLSFGAEYSFTKNTNRFGNQEGILDNTDDRMEESNMAAFAEYALKLKDWNVYAGLRYEATLSDYFERGVLVEEQSKDYHNLLPTFNLSGKIGPVQMLLGYAMRKGRPGYSRLSSNVQYNDRYNYEGGNPMLKPSTGHLMDLTLSYDFIQLQAYYTSINNVFIRTDRPYGEDAILYTYENFDNLQRLGAILVISPKISFWQPFVIVGVSKQFINEKALGVTENLGKPFGTFQLNNLLTLPWDITLQADFAYATSGSSMNNYEKSYYSLNVSLLKYFLNKKLAIKLEGNDILKTTDNKSIYYGRHMQMVRNAYNDSRSFTVGIQYFFNTGKSKYKGSGAGKEERSRL